MGASMKFIQAKNFTRAHRGAVDWIVIHATQGRERAGAAENTAKRFAGIGQDAPKASAHYAIDPSEAIQCVHETDVAWHCPGANRRGIGIEHCGVSEQTPAQWADETSEAELRQSAVLAAAICRRWGIPGIKLEPADIVRGMRGIAGHRDFSDAFATPGGHRDPGPDFPWLHYLELVKQAIDATTPPPVRAVVVEVEDDADDSGPLTTCADDQDVCEAPADWVQDKPAD
jgi:N-acetyl-anhydromuramyl-L-alanine amidase AmpD